MFLHEIGNVENSKGTFLIEGKDWKDKKLLS